MEALIFRTYFPCSEINTEQSQDKLWTAGPVPWNQTKKKKKKLPLHPRRIKIKPTMLKMAANGAGNGEKERMKCLIGQITHQEGHLTHAGEEKVCLITGGALMAASVKLLQQPIWPSTTGRPLPSERGPAAPGSRRRLSPAAAAGVLA